MIARWLRRLLLLELILYGSLGVLLGDLWPWVLALPVLVRAAWLGAIHLAAACFAEAVPAGSGGPLAAIRGFTSELLAMIYLFVLLQPLGQRLAVSPAGTGRGGEARGPIVVLVHGFGCNGRIWDPIRRRLHRQARVETCAPTLEPVLSDLDRLVDRLAEALAEPVGRAVADARPLVLVGHSMGGLLARRYLQRQPNPAVRAVITLASPHAGTQLARFHPAPNAVQMRPGSAWLRRLAGSPDPLPPVCVMTHHDQVVVPQSSALVPGGRWHRLAAVGHLALLLDRRVLQLLLEHIGDCAGDDRSLAGV